MFLQILKTFLTLTLIFNGPLKFLSKPYQTHSNDLFYWSLNSVNTRYIPFFSYWLAQFGAFLIIIWFCRSVALDAFQQLRCSRWSWNTVSVHPCHWIVSGIILPVFQLCLGQLTLLLECI